MPPSALNKSMPRARFWFGVRERARLVNQSQWIALMLMTGVIAVAVGICIWWSTQGSSVSDLSAIVKLIGALLSVIAALWLAAKSVSHFVSLDSRRSARIFIDTRPDPMEDLADHFRWVLKQARPGSVPLLIDDLDRCPETFVVELLDSVQKLMRDQESTIGQREQRKRQVRVRRIHHVAPSLVVIVAADGRWVRGSYDNTYASMTNAVNEPAATVGSLFLQKLFQLTVPVPRLSEGLKKEYLTGLLADQKGLL